MKQTYLNLDADFKPCSGDEIEYQQFTFSGGEPHIIINPNFDIEQPVVITHRIRSFNDLGFLCLAVDALNRMDIEPYKLIIPYFPAARQDRIMVKGEPLSVNVFAGIINSLRFKKVVVYDAHSEVVASVVNHIEVIPNHTFIAKVVQNIGHDVLLVSPDGGALKKIYRLSQYLGGKQVVECSKHRNILTGDLTGFKVYSDNLEGKDCLIVDDICDGGGTFSGLAQELKNKNAGKLYLAVSHGIFSKGFESLNCFAALYTTNSFGDCSHELVTQFKLGTDILFE